MTTVQENFETEAHETALKLRQDLICIAGPPVEVIAYEGEYCPEGTTPFVAHLYLIDPLVPNRNLAFVWAGTIARDDRLPTVDEIVAALTRWRAKTHAHSVPQFRVEWYVP